MGRAGGSKSRPACSKAVSPRKHVRYQARYLKQVHTGEEGEMGSYGAKMAGPRLLNTSLCF